MAEFIGLALFIWIAYTGLKHWSLAWYWTLGFAFAAMWLVAKALQGPLRVIMKLLRVALVAGCIVAGIWLAIRIFGH